MSSLSARIAVAASGAARKIGAALDNMGAGMEVAKFTERLVPSTRLVSVDGVAPALSGANNFIAPSASIIGNVTIGEHSSVWYGATVRGDVNYVTIGSKSSVGDRAVVHVAKIQGDFPTKIGNNVTIGAGAIIHACTIDDLVVIGETAQVLDGATVGTNAVVAAASIVTPGTKIPSGELWAGSPAKKVRALTSEEIASIAESAHDTLELAYLHAVENSKDYKQLIEEEEDRLDRKLRKDAWFDPNIPDPEDVLGQGVPGRIFNSTLTNPEEGLKMKAERNAKS
ncbi:hexapeptide repeat-containing transferase [Nitzschia inconspicua]|uniref:Hexapeptide repeat-containing transferase n=1 Tax=Nitzschia inconspicua TaxID=303405 RepID=A0A9K3Q325_9STRA|nr:hexapeptide repeat-containing transferase [Nitzschia inconspicua]